MTTFRRPRNIQATVLVLGAALIAGGHQAAAQQVIPQSLVVQGSLCTGFDCPNSPAFGFDTIILRENNLRIFFDDTSVAASFPRNDWRIIINDSANGGSSFFGVEDSTAARRVFQLTAGARANSIFVSSAGNVGFGTATPVVVTHARNGNTPTHRLEQDGSSGFAPQTWDLAGNETSFFIRDATNGSTLPFRIRPGAPSSSIDIAASGNVGVGTSSPQEKLHLSSNDNTSLRLETTGTSAAKWSISTVGNTGLLLFRDQNAATAPFRIGPGAPTSSVEIDSSGDVGIGVTNPAARFHTVGTVRFAGVANCSAGIMSNANGDLACLVSSRQFKTVTGDLTPRVALANIMALRPQVGSYKATPDTKEHWLIAEDVATVDGALVGLRNGKPYTVKTQNVVADLIVVIQQQQRRIEKLEAERKPSP